MIDVISKRCQHPGCTKQPVFAHDGETARFCASHKEPDMIDVKNKRCQHPGCTKHPVFAHDGETARFCASHKEPDMIDVKSKRCQHPGCTKIPAFAHDGETARFCASHKEPDMIDVINKRCQHPGCTKHPVFAHDGETARFCSSHKEPDMIDVKNNRCQHPGCDIRSSFGRPGTEPSSCARHKKPGFILKPSRRCVTKGCNEKAFFGSDFKLFHCEKHKQEDEHNYAERPCTSCRLPSLLDETDLCEMCHPDSFARAALSKQNKLMTYLDAQGLPGDSTDRMIDHGSCGRERPDRIYDIGDRIIILECDENQHRDRACECEQTRMVNITQALGGPRVCFLRFNPDEYKSEHGMVPLTKRYHVLRDLLKALVESRIDFPGFLCVRYLFFDGWSTLAESPFQEIS